MMPKGLNIRWLKKSSESENCIIGEFRTERGKPAYTSSAGSALKQVYGVYLLNQGDVNIEQ